MPSSSRFAIQGGFWIQPAPLIFVPIKTGDNFIFSFPTEPGKNYTVQYLDSLNSPNWQGLSITAGDGTVKTITNTAPAVLRRFFRLIEQ